jgi:hypothetical protein
MELSFEKLLNTKAEVKPPAVKNKIYKRRILGKSNN